ncbi:unnamed protein product [Caenorhabditis angaria]|uniref:RRM domain-containing protein n=1 Tax=Caenorhabditis angaria TaxID=860376 RepID=A0A9P1N6P2_9PELO|nr:unnamed protein product [Caenorhabditis angaria]
MPSKLFVGNLPENVDSNKLKQVFQPFCNVTECDIVKNYAFVHIDEDNVDPIIARLSGYQIDGQTVIIKKSISKLRPTPGMPNRCYRCQSDTHRTPQCPQDPNNSKPAESFQTIKIDLTSGLKRSAEPIKENPAAKRMAIQQGSTVEAEIPQPHDPDLQQLYQEYQLSRTRLIYYRDRLLKEMEAKNPGSTSGYILSTNILMPTTPVITSSSASQVSGAPVSYQPSAIVPPANAPYATATPQAPASNLRAPYAAPSAPYAMGQTVPQMAPYGGMVAPPMANGGAMTSQQYLQQQQQMHPNSPLRRPAMGGPPQPNPSGSQIQIKWT